MATKKNIAADLRKRNLRTSENAVLKKGMELPVNTLVVVAIAVIVILAIAAFFMGGFGGSSKDIQNRQAFMNECSGWTQTGCGDTDMPSNLKELYMIWQPNVDFSDSNNVGNSGLSETDYLKKQCGCFGTGTPNPTQKLCSERSISECTGNCELKTCSELGGGFACKSDAIIGGAFDCPVEYPTLVGSYTCSTIDQRCCKQTSASETNVCKTSSVTSPPTP